MWAGKLTSDASLPENEPQIVQLEDEIERLKTKLKGLQGLTIIQHTYYIDVLVYGLYKIKNRYGCLREYGGVSSPK